MPPSRSSSGCPRCALRPRAPSHEQGAAASLSPRQGLRPRPPSGLRGGRQAEEKLKQEKFVLSVAYSPNGQRLACGAMDGTVAIFDVPSGKLLHTLRGHHHPVRDLSFTPGARRPTAHRPLRSVAQTSACAAPLTRGAWRRLQIHTDGVRRHALQPVRHRARLAGGGLLGCGARAAGGCSGLLARRRCAAALPARSPACTGEHRDMTLWGCGRMRWRVADALRAGPGSRNMPATRGRQHGECCVPGNRGTACMDPGMGGKDPGRAPRAGHESWVLSVACHPNGSAFATGSSDARVKLWDLQTRTCAQTVTEHTDQARPLRPARRTCPQLRPSRLHVCGQALAPLHVWRNGPQTPVSPYAPSYVRGGSVAVRRMQQCDRIPSCFLRREPRAQQHAATPDPRQKASALASSWAPGMARGRAAAAAPAGPLAPSAARACRRCGAWRGRRAAATWRRRQTTRAWPSMTSRKRLSPPTMRGVEVERMVSLCVTDMLLVLPRRALWSHCRGALLTSLGSARHVCGATWCSAQ